MARCTLGVVVLLLWPTMAAGAASDFFTFLATAERLQAGGEVQLTSTFEPSGSTWAEGLDERTVFHSELAWRGKSGRWYALRVGRGGQIYSLRGPFGESVPPQVHQGAPWIDEVWQIVSVSHARNNPERFPGRGAPLAYFIHGSGIYLRDPQRPEPFYCPMLASDWDPERRRYGVLAWGQHAHVPTVHRSGALYYTGLRALSDGVIEIVYAVHNFGRDTLDYFNTPWGGVRHSTLPVHLLSRPDGSAPEAGGRFGARENICTVSETGGWAAFAQDGGADEERWGLGLVFGRGALGDLSAGRGPSAGPAFAPTRYRWGYAGNPDRPNPRDYFVAVVNPRRPVAPGETFWYRIYFIVDRMDRLPETARRLVSHAGGALITPSRKDAPLVAVDAAALGLEQRGDSRRTLFRAYAWPAAGTRPLFLLRETATGRVCVTDDPYRFASTAPLENPYPADHPSHKGYEGLRVLRPYDGKTDYLGMLGYGVRAGTGSGTGADHVPLVTVLRRAGLAGRVEAAEGLAVVPPAPTPPPAATGAGDTPAGCMSGR
jgi:hypothetical protein